MIEEIYFRGYVRTRLTEAWGPLPAILITSAFMAFMHAQYLHVDVLNVGTLAGILMFSIGAGFVFHETKSLLGPIVIHMLLNIPLQGRFIWVAPTVMLLTVLLTRRAIAAWLSRLRAIGFEVAWGYAGIMVAFTASFVTVSGAAVPPLWVTMIGAVLLVISAFSATQSSIRCQGQMMFPKR